jgi:hypothetical protein
MLAILKINQPSSKRIYQRIINPNLLELIKIYNYVSDLKN